MSTVVGRVVAPTAAPAREPLGRPELSGQLVLAVSAGVLFHVFQFCDVGPGLLRGTGLGTVLRSLNAVTAWGFVLAGLVLCEPLARAVRAGPAAAPIHTDLAAWALRVLPITWAAMLVVWVARQRTLPGDWRDLLEHLTFTQVFDGRRIFFTIGPAWALADVVLFAVLLALVAPGLARWCGRRSTPRRRLEALAAVAGAPVLIALAWRTGAYAVGDRPTAAPFTAWFGPLANLDAFGVGALLAVLLAARGAHPLAEGRRQALRLVGVIAVVLGALGSGRSGWADADLPTACAVGFGCLVAARLLSPTREGPDTPPLERAARWLAAGALGVLVWHEPIMLGLHDWPGLVEQRPGAYWLDLLVVLPASVLAGRLSLVLVGRPVAQLALALDREEPAGPGTRG